ncbi:MAG: DUF2244 domain-containing protein [Hyphomicrobiaceae bacterium]
MLNQSPELAQPPEFAAVLRPNRSLSPLGFAIFMGAISVFSFLVGLYFWTIGAWPVLGFFGLDVLAIYVAFQLNYRSGRICETVTLHDHQLEVARILPSGRSWHWSFNPSWVRLELDEHPSGTADLWLRSGTDAVSVGQFLSDPERRDFAGALRSAIGAHRAGV